MVYLGIIAGIFVLDFFIKRYVEEKFERRVKHPKLGGFVYIEKYYNNGAMLNLLEKWPGMLKIVQTVFLILVSIWFYILLRRNEGAVVGKLGTAFLVGGGLSNLVDRYTKGHVVDYISFGFGPEWFRRIVFNVSDFFIFIGGVLAVIGHK